MKKFKISLPQGKTGKRLLASVGAFAVLVAAFFLSPPGKSVMAAALKRDLPIYCVQKEKKVVALTFDAAWGNGKVRHAPARRVSLPPVQFKIPR